MVQSAFDVCADRAAFDRFILTSGHEPAFGHAYRISQHVIVVADAFTGSGLTALGSRCASEAVRTIIANCVDDPDNAAFAIREFEQPLKDHYSTARLVA